MYNLQQNFCIKTYKNWQSGVPNGEQNSILKNQGHHILQVLSRQKFRTHSKAVWQETQNLSSSEISRIHFQLQIHFPKTLRGNPGALQHQVSTNQTISQQKWGPSPSTILQIYKQCVRPIFEYGSLSTIATSDTIISKIQWLQNKFIRLALHLPKYVNVKLSHDSSGLPYVKYRPLSCATRTLERISKNPLAEESITFNRVNHAWDRFPTPLSVIRPVSL